jgi:cell division protease FtsH
MPDPEKSTDPNGKPAAQRNPMQWLVLILLGGATLLLVASGWTGETSISFSELLNQVEADNVKRVNILSRQVIGEFKTPKPISRFQTTLPPQVGEEWLNLLRRKSVEIHAENPTNYDDIFFFVSLLGLALLVLFAWNMMRRTRDQMMGGGMLGGVIKSPARRYDANDRKITFNDVAGLEGVKKDLEEIVQYLKDAPKFQRLGAQVPKGVLLMGPPGTGKTLLARAVAGEAGVPFFSINGSEFIQLFVGVGAGRVRDMFKTAQDNAPAILFIDEIDAVGRQRGAGLGGGHDEREQTLNQILSEMDGFSPTSTVIVLAATNRPDVLDPALLRPGRFDRHVTVDRPTVRGRKELFELHSKNVPLTEEVDFDKLARGTVGLTGADIRNLVNEAALWATRQNKDMVGPEDFEYARDKVLMGSTREDILTPDEKKVTAYHESGHALVAWLLPDCEPVHKVTIIPRGRALGVTQLVPDEDRFNANQGQMHAMLAMILAGRTAEKMQFDQYSAGAENDLKRATELARKMVTRWGMSEKLGPVAYSNGEEHPFLGREMAHENRTFSERTAQTIDEEIAKILHSSADRASKILDENREKLEKLASALLEREALDSDDMTQLIGPAVRHPRSKPIHVPI